MTRRTLILALCLVLVLAVAVGVASRPHGPAGAGASTAARPLAAPAPGSPPTDPYVSEGAQRLDAVRTVKLFCDLVDSRRLWRAAELFATPRVWPRDDLRALRGLEFRAARVHVATDEHTLIVAARVHATGGHGSPVSDGDTTLFFTLGRVGSTAGGWLISAVTSPQPDERGPS